MSQVQYIIIDDNNAEQRIDNFLLAFFKRQIPKSLIYRKIRKGEVRVNKKRIKPVYKLQMGDQVRIPPVSCENPNPVSHQTIPSKWLEKIEDAILYEETSFFVINKPSGLAVHGGTGVNIGLIEVLRQMRPEVKFLELVHRLDRDTSGCILIAKKRSALLNLHEQLKHHTMRKCYHAVVIGRWPKHINKINVPLKKNTLQSGERVVQVDVKDGKSCLTTFQILQKSTDLTLVAAFPQTGRTHQIRVHTKYAKYPILGDEKYAHRQENRALMKQYDIKRLCLHAYQLEFVSPDSGETISVQAEYDQPLQNLISRLI